jgi:diphthamide synthase (EF-2-diphthine--ammonia ligase)
MHREFEELGVNVGDVLYGHFTGEAQFDETGQAVIIDIEASGFNSKALGLDIEDLVRQRIALRRKLGITFLEDGGEEVSEHALKWALFQGLSDSVEALFKEDIEDYLADLIAGSAHWDAA